MQSKSKNKYSPLRNRHPGDGPQALEPPSLFRNSSIDGSKDALKESRSRSKSSERGPAGPSASYGQRPASN